MILPSFIVEQRPVKYQLALAQTCECDSGYILTVTQNSSDIVCELGESRVSLSARQILQL